MSKNAAAAKRLSDAPAPEAPALSVLARAKVNLCLHVVGRCADGYHLLDSLVAFPAVGDRLSAAPSAAIELVLDGPAATGLSAGADNLALRAARALDAWMREGGADEPPRGAALRLSKHLPHAAGLGGGSSDAAVALRLLARLWRGPQDEATLARIGLTLGADVPVCLRAPRASRMRGIGEILTPAPALPRFWMTLVHPGQASPTAEVFARLERRDGAPPPEPPERFRTLEALAQWLERTRNDLETPAQALRPSIAEARAALGSTAGCRLARMSGSGAACFGLYAREAEARAAAAEIAAARPDWWCAAAPVTQDEDV